MATLISFLMIAQPVVAQCSAPGCEEATAVVSAARATARAVLTREAPPTVTPLPTMTPVPTSTSTPTATATSRPTDTPTPAPSATPTMQASATSQPTVTTISTPTPTTPARKASTIYDDWPLVVLILGGALAIIIALYRLLIGRETILPGRGNRSDDGRFH